MVNAQNIITRVANLYDVTVDDILSDKRHRVYADARAVICYVLCSLDFCTVSACGRLLNRTHATVIYHNRRAGEWVRKPKLNPSGAKAIMSIEKEYIN